MLEYLKEWLHDYPHGTPARVRLVDEKSASHAIMLAVDEAGIVFRRIDSHLHTASPWSAVEAVILDL